MASVATAWLTGSLALGAASLPPPDWAVVAYAEANLTGPHACLAAGHHDRDALAAAGLPRGEARSLRVAPGHEARMRRHRADADNAAGERPAAAADADADADADDTWFRTVGETPTLPLAGPDGTVTAIAATVRPAVAGRARALLAMHGSNVLADAEHRDAWAQVAAQVDAVWGNDAYITPAAEAAIYRQLATRTLIQEQDLVGGRARLIPLGVYAGLQRQYPDLVLQREAMAVHRDRPRHWRADDVDAMRAAYVAAPAVAAQYRFAGAYTGWQAAWGADALPPDAAAALAAGDGAFVECDAATCLGAARRGLFRLAAAARAGGRPFIWYDSTAGAADGPTFLAATVDLALALADAGLLGPRDGVVVINEMARLPTLPEADADGRPAATVMGTLLWLLRQ